MTLRASSNVHASIRYAEGNSAVGVALFGLIDRRIETTSP